MERAVIKVITANWSDDRINVSLFSSLFRFAMLFIHTNIHPSLTKLKHFTDSPTVSGIKEGN